MALTSPPYSFIQFNPASPNACYTGINSIQLPIVNASDLLFQVIATSAPTNVQVVNEAGTVISTQSGFVSTPIAGVYSWTGSIDISALACDQCFYLKIDGANQSNMFIKKCDGCFTSLLEYSDSNDYANFVYCNANFINRVRLPMYLRKPGNPEDRGVYIQSQGIYKITRSVISKQYEFVTDYMPEFMHDALAIMFGHDDIFLYSNEYNGIITKNGDVKAAWDDELQVAQATGSIAAAPFSIRKNNCSLCIPIVVPVCVAVSIPSTTFSNATVGVAYSKAITVNGTAPFTFSSIVSPAWLTGNAVGSTITFTGTPTSGDIGTGIAVGFDVLNACGTDSLSTTMTVAVVSCAPVGIVGTPVLPDGYVGGTYFYSFDLSGDAPFTLSSVSKPSWMSIDVVGSSIEFTGTPDVDGTAITVSLTVNNCTSDSVDFTDSIDVSASLTLSFFNYLAGNFSFKLLPAHPTSNLTITAASVSGWLSLDCSGGPEDESDSLFGSLVINAGSTLGSHTGGTAFSGAINTWKRVNSITVSGAGSLGDGSTFTLGGILIIVSIDYSTCENY